MNAQVVTVKPIDMREDSRPRLVLAVAVSIRAIILAHLFFNPSGMFANADSLDFHKLGVSILHRGTFSREPLIHGSLPDYVNPPKRMNYDPPLAPDYFRTPVYPTFLAIIYGLGGTPYAAIVVQSLLSLLLLWLIILFTSRLFGARAALAAGILAAVEPLSLIYSHQVMSDTLFVLLVFAATMIFWAVVLNGDPAQSLKLTLLGGLLLGLAVLARPIGTYLPFVFAGLTVFYLYACSRERVMDGSQVTSQHSRTCPQPRALVVRRLLCFLFAGALTMSIWVTRNYFVFGRPFISTSSDHILLMTAASQIMAEIQDPQGTATTQQVRDGLEAELMRRMALEGRNANSPPERVAYFREWSMSVIRSHPGRFVLYMLKGSAFLFVSDITGMYQLLGFTTEAKGGWGILFRSGIRPALEKYFGAHWPVWVAASLPVIVYDMLLYSMALAGAIRLWRMRAYYLFCFFVSMVGYWIAVSSVGGMPRYRFPMMPLLICLAASVVSGSRENSTSIALRSFVPTWVSVGARDQKEERPVASGMESGGL